MGDRPWFRRKRSGLGWTPITWQGWLVTILGAAIGIAVNPVIIMRAAHGAF